MSSKSLHTYFKRKESQASLLDPKGPLSKDIPSAVIVEANKEVLQLQSCSTTESKKKGPYLKVSQESKLLLLSTLLKMVMVLRLGNSEIHLRRRLMRALCILGKSVRAKKKSRDAFPEIKILPEAKRGRPLLNN